MKIEYDNLYGLKERLDLHNVVEEAINLNSLNTHGELESMRDNQTKLTEIVGRLLETLVERKIISLQNAEDIIDSFRHKNLSEIKGEGENGKDRI